VCFPNPAGDGIGLEAAGVSKTEGNMSRKRTMLMVLAMLASTTATIAAFLSDVLLKGLDASKPVVLVVNGTERPLGTVGAGGNMSIPLDASLDAALDPNKNYVVMKREACNRYEIVEEREAKQRCRDEQRDESGQSCGRCVPVGLIVKGEFQATPPSAAGPPAAPTGGPLVDVVFLGGWNRTTFPGVDQAEGTIAGRYTSGTAPYNQFSTTVDRRDNGFGAGAGVRVMFGNVGILGAYAYQDVGGGEVHTSGTRVLNDLAFRLDSDFTVDTHKIVVGVPIGTARFQFIPFYGRAFWNLNRTIVDELRVGGVQVRGGTTPYSAEGSDHLLGARVEAYLHRAVGVFGEFEKINFRNVFQPDGPDALPVHLDNTNINVGVVVRLPVRR
jgi:hypothetical protein